MRCGALSKTHRAESSRQHPGAAWAPPPWTSQAVFGSNPAFSPPFFMPTQLSNSVLCRYVAAEPLSGLVATAQTESWSPRGTRIGLRIFALRSSAALFCHRYQSTANARSLPSDQSKRRQEKNREIHRITSLLPNFVLTNLPQLLPCKL